MRKACLNRMARHALHLRSMTYLRLNQTFLDSSLSLFTISLKGRDSCFFESWAVRGVLMYLSTAGSCWFTQMQASWF